MTHNDELFCVGQKAVIRKGSQVLVLHDPVPSPGNIDLPGGKIQEGERDFPAALQREVREETGLEITVGRPFFTHYWEFPADSPHRNRGKKIYLVFYECAYASGEVRISGEHDWFRWVTADDYERLFENKNNVYKALSRYFLLKETA